MSASWLVMQPLLASLIDPVRIAGQQVKLGFLKDLSTAGGLWRAGTHVDQNLRFDQTAPAHLPLGLCVRLIGAGCGGYGRSSDHADQNHSSHIVLSFKESIGSVKEKAGKDSRIRTERDLSIRVVAYVGMPRLVLR